MHLRFLIVLLMLGFVISMNGQNKEISMFIFGHSLLDHRPPVTATPSDETTVPHWMFLLAESAENSYAAGGQYGFLQQHANLPPFSQWGYDVVPGVWDSDEETFAEAEINTILITAGNFIQYQGPELPYEDPNNTENVSPVSATETIVDWVGENTNEATIYIYENWPDMAGFIAGEGFPASASEFLTYNEYTRNEFHNWWITYQDKILESKPSANIRMIPVGPIIADLLDNLLKDVEFSKLYEDNAPHGTPNIYFLAGLISYMAVYEEIAPADYTIPELIDPIIRDHYSEVVDFIWQYLLEFNLDNGDSRVFNSIPSKVEFSEVYDIGDVSIFPNPTNDIIFIESNEAIGNLEIRNMLGELLIEQNALFFNSVNVSSLFSGQYTISFETEKGMKFHRSFIKVN